MFAIVQLGSLQYKVAEGDTIDAQLLDEKEGKSLIIDQVLFFTDGKTVKIGQPFLKDVKVTAKVLAHHKDEKKLSFKYLRRKDKYWRQGHRQKLTQLNITKIAVG